VVSYPCWLFFAWAKQRISRMLQQADLFKDFTSETSLLRVSKGCAFCLSADGCCVCLG
jgi:hypothetical protein